MEIKSAPILQTGEPLTRQAGATPSEPAPAVREVEEVREIDREELEATVKGLNDSMDDLQTTLGFSINAKTGDLVVNVIDRSTSQVIRQIPSEEAIDLKEKMAELAGIFLNKMA